MRESWDVSWGNANRPIIFILNGGATTAEECLVVIWRIPAGKRRSISFSISLLTGEEAQWEVSRKNKGSGGGSIRSVFGEDSSGTSRSSTTVDACEDLRRCDRHHRLLATIKGWRRRFPTLHCIILVCLVVEPISRLIGEQPSGRYLATTCNSVIPRETRRYGRC